MPIWVWIAIGAVALVLILALKALFSGKVLLIVKQDTRAMKERWGKYVGALEPGSMHWLLPFRDKVAGVVKLNLQSHSFDVNTRTNEDGTRVDLKVFLEFCVNPAKVREAWYAMQQPATVLQARATDVITKHLYELSLAQALVSANEIAKAVKDALAGYAAQLGYEITNVLVTQIEPEASVRQALSAKAAAQRTNETDAANAAAANQVATDKAIADATVARTMGDATAAAQSAIMNALIATASQLVTQRGMTFPDALRAVTKIHETDATAAAIRAAGTAIVTLGADGTVGGVAAGTMAATKRSNERV